MKITLVDKKKDEHVNPPLVGGNIYKNIDTNQYYFAYIHWHLDKSICSLANINSGNAWSHGGGFSKGRFIDVTNDVFLTVKV